MKRLFFALAMLIATSSYAQEPFVIETYKNTTGIKNEFTGKFDFGKVRYANIKFFVYDSHITADDEAHSIYRINEVKKLNDGKTYYFATDEQNRDCALLLSNLDDGAMIFSVIYKRSAYAYFVR